MYCTNKHFSTCSILSVVVGNYRGGGVFVSTSTTNNFRNNEICFDKCHFAIIAGGFQFITTSCCRYQLVINKSN